MYDVRNSTCEKATTAVLLVDRVEESIGSDGQIVFRRNDRHLEARRLLRAEQIEHRRKIHRGADDAAAGARRPEARERDGMCAVVTFSCMLTEPAGAPMIRATLSPTSRGISHQRSSHPRTPRVAHVSAYSARSRAVRRGIAPSELLIM